MWKVAVVLFVLGVLFLIMKKHYKKKKKQPRNRTGDLIKDSDMEDMYGQDILDKMCAKITGTRP